MSLNKILDVITFKYSLSKESLTTQLLKIPLIYMEQFFFNPLLLT